jgi:hypothetical protein
MVRAGWLTPDIAWPYLRQVCAGDGPADEGDDAEFIAPRPGASTELQIAKAIERALDVRATTTRRSRWISRLHLSDGAWSPSDAQGFGAIRVTRNEDDAAIEADDFGCLTFL